MTSMDESGHVRQVLRLALFTALDGNLPIPIYAQIADCIQRAVERGELTPGRIDSEALLAKRIGRSIQSVAKAFRLLIDRGVLASIFHRGPAGCDSSAVAVVGC